MLNWIAGFVDRWRDRIGQDLRDLVHWTVHALAGVVYTVFGNVGRGWRHLWLAFEWLGRQATGFIAETYGWIRQIITTDLPWLWHILLSDIKGVLALIDRVYRTVAAAILAAVRYAESLVRGAIRWTVDHVWAPLKAYADAIYRDLLKWGYAAYQLVTHPDRLAVILLDAMIAAAEAAFWRIAGPAGRFALGLVLHNARRFALLLESIVAAVL